jgi:membrane protease YdiL (CAAX protease family)
MLGKVKARTVALVEVLVVLAIAYAIRSALRYWGAGFAAGAISTIVTVAISTWLLRRRGIGWRTLGFRRPARLRSAAQWTAVLFLAGMFLSPLVAAAISDALHFPPQRLDAFATLPGNLIFYLVLVIPIAWGTAAFGEELIFRGFVLRRLSDALGGSQGAEVGGVVIQAMLFGLAHAYLGPRGMLNAGALGLLSGFCYRFNGRNLWPLIVAHGLVDTVGLTVLYLGLPHA